MATKEWYQQHKDLPEYKLRIKQNTQRWQENHPERYILSQAKGRAKKKGIPFNIEEEDIHIPEFCPILGIELKFNEEHAAFCSPTIDRIIPEVGYVKGNVQIISSKANLMKSSATPEELLNFARWILKYKNHS